MSNPDRTHVTIGAYSFRLDEKADGSHYEHAWVPRLSNRIDITGKPGTQSLTPEHQYFTYDDWSGGEVFGGDGTIVYNQNDPIVFDHGTGNPRNPGKLTSAPARTDATIEGSLDADLDTVGFFTNADGRIWFASSHNTDAAAAYKRVLRYSTDGSTWTAAAAFEATGASGATKPGDQYKVASVCGDTKYCYICVIDTAGSKRTVWRVRITTAVTEAMSAEDSSSVAYQGMATLGPYLYGWTGARLFQHDITLGHGVPAGSTIVYDSGVGYDSAEPFPAGFYAGAIATDNSVAMFFSDGAGVTGVHEFKGGVGVPIWTLPPGVTGTALGFSNGFLYLAGTYDSNAALFKMDLQSRQASFVDFIRKGTTLTPVSVAAGPGDQVLIGMKEGYVFIYDAGADSISLLDSLTTLTALVAVGTYKSNRVAAFRDVTGSAFKSSKWVMDSVGGAANGTFDLVMPVWDIALPMEPNKTLVQFKVRTSALSATKTLQVQYQLEEPGVSTWTTTTALVSGTDNTITVSTGSSTIHFGQLRMRVVGTGSSGSVCPTLYAISADIYNVNHEQVWNLRLKLRDESEDNAPSSRSLRAWQLADYLKTLKSNKSLVTFVDAYDYQEPGTGATSVTSYVCGVEDVSYRIDTKNQGWALVRLRSMSL